MCTIVPICYVQYVFSLQVSTIGTVLVFFMLCSQLPAMYTVIRYTKSVANLSVLPTCGQMANFATWVVYGFYKSDPNIWRVNLIGVGFAVFYLTVFLIYATGANRTALYQTLLAVLVVLGGAEVALAFLVHDSSLQLTLMGA